MTDKYTIENYGTHSSIRDRDNKDFACLNFRKEFARIGDAIGVVAEGAQANDAVLLVARGDGRGRAPLLVQLEPCGEKVDVRFER